MTAKELSPKYKIRVHQLKLKYEPTTKKKMRVKQILTIKLQPTNVEEIMKL